MAKGYVLSESDRRRVAAAVRAFESATGATTATGSGTLLVPNRQRRRRGSSQVSNAPIRMRVKSIQNDYLTCRTWDGTTEGDTNLYVAKPAQLRHTYTLYEGLTGLTTTDAQTVSAVSGSITETWKVTPDYIVDGDIYASSGPAGGTGVSLSGTPLTLIDLNLSGRAWAVEP